MLRVQVSVTPNEAKQLIARAIPLLPEVKQALQSGKVVIKGGSTGSAIAEYLASVQLRIAGRITQLGTKAPHHPTGNHTIMLENGKITGLDTDSELQEASARMNKNDVFVTGANAIDCNRKAAVMVGVPLSPLSRFIPTMIAKGITVIIGVGWEKLIPGSIDDALNAVSFENTDLSMGMAVGLLPLRGKVITETDAISLLSGAEATVIGAGGISGGEGSTTIIIQGNREQVKSAWDAMRAIKGAGVSGIPETLEECIPPKSPFCKAHLDIGSVRILAHKACIYRQPKLDQKIFRKQAD
jgi:hypothetical protein